MMEWLMSMLRTDEWSERRDIIKEDAEHREMIRETEQWHLYNIWRFHLEEVAGQRGAALDLNFNGVTEIMGVSYDHQSRYRDRDLRNWHLYEGWCISNGRMTDLLDYIDPDDIAGRRARMGSPY